MAATRADLALSRQQHGFDSRRGYHPFNAVLSFFEGSAIIGVERILGTDMFGAGACAIHCCEMMLNLCGTVNYSQISPRHLPWALNRA